jgi:hypothetical protein
LLYKKNAWQDEQVTRKPNSHFLDSNLNIPVSYKTHCFFINSTDDFDDWIESHLTTSVNIMRSKYESVDIDEVARQQKRLSKSQQDDLARILREYTQLFSCKLGCYPGYKVHLELLENAQPFHYRPYPIPTNNAAVFKEELERLVQIGVLSRTGPSEWLSPTFIVPKKDGRVRFVSDNRTLNRIIKGIKQSPNVAEEIMEILFRDLDEVDTYIDDVGCFSNSWKEHLQSVYKVFTILHASIRTLSLLVDFWTRLGVCECHVIVGDFEKDSL